MGLTIIDFARINNREETFDVHGYLEMRWLDKRLKRNPGSGSDRKPGKKRRLHPSHELWIPRLSFMNAVEEVKIVSHAEIFTDDDGNVSQGLDFTGKFSNPLDLRRFPFDSQILRILIQPTDSDKNEVILIAGESRSGVLDGSLPLRLGRGNVDGSFGRPPLQFRRNELFHIHLRDTESSGARPFTCFESCCH